MVGAALAAALADDFATHGLSIRVIDGEVPAPVAEAPPDSVDEVEPRVSALTLASQAMLARLGAWQRIPEGCLAAYDAMEVWDAEGTGRIRFDAVESGTATLGWIVGNAQLAAALGAVCRSKSAIDWLAPARVASCARRDERWCVSLADGRVLSANLLVGADGARSIVRDAAGIAVRAHDYRQQAIVATVEMALPHGNCARQRFMDSGPLALLPLPGTTTPSRRGSIVWTVPSAQAADWLSLDDAAFSARLAAALEGRLGEVVALSRRAAFPLIEQHAAGYAVDGAVLAGDAAHTVHPLAGQGVNLGLLDAATLAEELSRNLARGLPFDEPQALRRYARRRRHHNLRMQKSFAGFNRLFAERRLPVRWLRNTGMNLLDGQLPLKVLIARQAMGLEGDLPALCRQPLRGDSLLDETMFTVSPETKTAR